MQHPIVKVGAKREIVPNYSTKFGNSLSISRLSKSTVLFYSSYLKIMTN